jgi:class 3 adenylate cyclase
MSLQDDLANDVNTLLNQEWSIREGQVVPTSDSIALAGGAAKLSATILYADLADSTELAIKYDRRVAAKVYKCFLSCCSKIIRARGGDIRSFDGDRVMSIFVGNYKNTSAAKCALQINHAFLKIIKPKLEAKYDSLKSGSYKLAHCVGIDTSEVLTVRAGIRKNNDLVWVGRAPNIAAKLSTLRESPFHSYITEDVYNSLAEEAKLSSGAKKPMWESRSWKTLEPFGIKTIYRSSWTWSGY